MSKGPLSNSNHKAINNERPKANQEREGEEGGMKIKSNEL